MAVKNPPPELVEEWCRQLFGCDDKPELAAYELARLAAAWGYRQCDAEYERAAMDLVPIPED